MKLDEKDIYGSNKYLGRLTDVQNQGMFYRKDPTPWIEIEGVRRIRWGNILTWCASLCLAVLILYLHITG